MALMSVLAWIDARNAADEAQMANRDVQQAADEFRTVRDLGAAVVSLELICRDGVVGVEVFNRSPRFPILVTAVTGMLPEDKRAYSPDDADKIKFVQNFNKYIRWSAVSSLDGELLNPREGFLIPLRASELAGKFRYGETIDIEIAFHEIIAGNPRSEGALSPATIKINDEMISMVLIECK